MMAGNKLLVVDLEATCSEDDTISRSNMEIIEIGAAIVCCSNLEIVDTFQVYVRPVVTPMLTGFCTELTGIEQETVDAAEPFGLAVTAYREWLGRHPELAAWASWGNYDKGQFELDCERHCVPGLHANLLHLNLKNFFAKAVGEKRMGLGRAIKFVGATFEGRAHCGLDDAINMSKLLSISPEFGTLIKERIDAS